MDISKIKPEDIEVLMRVFSLPKETVIFDPEGKLEGECSSVISDITKLLQQSGRFSVCVNLSGKKLEISAFDFILEFGISNSYKSLFCEAFLTVSNPDGSIRWFQSSKVKQAHFLNLYNGIGLKAAIFKMVMRMVFAANLQKFLLKGNFYLHSKEEAYFQKQFQYKEIAVFTGTVGENRKAVAALCEQGHISHFIKIPISEIAKQLICSEHEHLKTIHELDFQKLVVPTAEMKTSGLQLTNIRPAEPLSSIAISHLHLSAIHEIYAHTLQIKMLSTLEAFTSIRYRLRSIKALINQSSGDIPHQKSERMAYNLKVLSNSFDGSQLVPVAYAHGDFTPWNMFVSEDRIHLYDWELAMPEQLLLYDIFHFVFQSAVLILHQPFSQIILKIKQLKGNPAVQEIIKQYSLNFWDCYRWYLLYNCSYYLPLYLKQPHLHEQAYWLVDCWIAATNDAIKNRMQKPKVATA